MKSVHKTIHKKVHKNLKLRHRKHTGKVLAHRHTSYRVLFGLMLLPIIMMSLVTHMEASADLDLAVSATVPAPIPGGKPVIVSPMNNQVLASQNVTVTGTCPVITPAIIIAIYSSSTLKGSSICTVAGEFSVPMTLGIGTHTLTAVVKTITDGTGETSDPVTVELPAPVKPSPSPSPSPSASPTLSPKPNTPRLSSIPFIAAANVFAPIRFDGVVTWSASVVGGVTPYTVTIDWGDGAVETYTVEDGGSQDFTHDYGEVKSYDVSVTVVDANGKTSRFQTVAASMAQQRSATPALDSRFESTPPVVLFLQRYAWPLYIGTLFALVFLWYIHHVGGLFRIFHR